MAAYGVMHRWRKMPDESQVLLIGPDNFPFPIPLKKNTAGSGTSTRPRERKRFWPAVLAGMNWRYRSLCGAGDAQAEYFSQPHADGSRTSSL